MSLTEKFSPEAIHELAEKFETAHPTQMLEWAADHFPGTAAIGTSFQGAGLVIIDLATQAGLELPVFTLDTGLLFPETEALAVRLEEFFGISIERMKPELSVTEQSVEHGPELWKRAPDLCCTMRKVLPLQSKLNHLDVWITGLRRQQSETRQRTLPLELYKFDVLRDQSILKMNPLVNWSKEAVWEHLRRRKIPYNPLTDRGYRSIGCWPCTRAIQDGDSERAGRWTGFDKAECGIHTFLGSNI